MPLARISLTFSRHFSPPFIASGRSSGLHPVSSHSGCMYVRAGRPAFAWPYAGVHRSTSLMSLSLLLQQYLACLVRLTCIVFVMGGKWPYSWCLVRKQLLVKLQDYEMKSFFLKHLVNSMTFIKKYLAVLQTLPHTDFISLPELRIPSKKMRFSWYDT